MEAVVMKMSIWLLSRAADAVVMEITSQAVRYVIENQDVLLAQSEVAWNETVSLVNQVINTGWERHDAAISCATQALTDLLGVIEQRRVSCHRHCEQTVECIKNILFMEVRWAW